MTLEDLVPPLEQCKRIPAGEFGYSALAWFGHKTSGDFELAENIVEDFCRSPRFWDRVAAPTLAEIMAQLDGLVFCPTAYLLRNEFHVSGDKIPSDIPASYVVECSDKYNPATAALRLWLKLKGIEE